MYTFSRIATVVLAATALALGTTNPAHATAVYPTPITFAVVGDSNTAALTRSLTQGVTAEQSWAYWASTTGWNRVGTRLVGGWAVSGANTAAMRAGLPRLKPHVFVILAGTNNIPSGPRHESTAQTLSDIRAMITRMGGTRIIIAAVPPLDAGGHTAAATAYNRVLLAFATSHGYGWIDPWAAYRTAGGHWVAGASVDGVHGTPTVWATVGLTLGRAIARYGA